MGDFNARSSSNQAILLSNYSGPNPLWLEEDLELDNRYKRSYKYLGENLLSSELVKFCSAQDLIVCNGLTKEPNSSHMTCIHGIGCGVVDYVISDILIYNKLIDFNIFNDHEPDSDHRPVIITLNIAMHSDPKEENYHFQKHMIFDKHKANIFLHNLKNVLVPLSSMENIENI